MSWVAARARSSRYHAALSISLAVVAFPATHRAQGLNEAPPVRPRLERMIRDTTLANGLTIIVAENHASPVATVELAVRTGAFTQQAGEEGVAHLFEHILFRAYGTQTAEFALEVGRMNGRHNGSTHTEHVAYFVTVPSKNAERATGLLAKLVIDPPFRDRDLADEVQVVVGEYERNASDPAFAAHELSEQALWGDALPRKNALGSPRSLAAINRERLREIYNRFYVPNNTAVIVSGDVEAAAAIKWVVSRFGSWKKAPDPFATPVPPVPPLTRSSVLIVPADIGQVSLVVNWHGPSAREDVRNTYVADVFSDMMNTQTSPMHERLSASGLFHGVGVNYYTQGFSGPISVGGVTSVQRVAEAARELRSVIASFDSPAYLTPDLLTEAKQRRTVQTEFGLERGSGLAHSLSFWWAVMGLDYFRGYVDNMRTVTIAELQAYVRRYIRNQPYVVTAIVPRGTEATVGPAVRAAFDKPATP